MFRYVFSAILLSSPANAGGIIRISEVGLSSCSTYLHAREGVPDGSFESKPIGPRTFYGPSERFIQWIDGYVTSYNFSTKGKMVQLTDKERDAWIGKYCRDNPGDTMMMAVNLYLGFHAQQEK